MVFRVQAAFYLLITKPVIGINHAPRCGTLWHGRASSVLRPAQSGAQVGIGQKCRTVDNQIGNAFFQSRLACVAGKNPIYYVTLLTQSLVVNSITICYMVIIKRISCLISFSNPHKECSMKQNVIVALFDVPSEAYQAFSELKAYTQTADTLIAQAVLIKKEKRPNYPGGKHGLYRKHRRRGLDGRSYRRIGGHTRWPNWHAAGWYGRRAHRQRRRHGGYYRRRSTVRKYRPKTE